MLDKSTISTIKEAAQKLTGSKRRGFEAKVTNDYLSGSARKAERIFKWGRKTVQLGQKELETGIICIDNHSARGRKKMEETTPSLISDIAELLENGTQTDPKFQTSQRFCRISAQSTCRMLEQEKGYASGKLKIRTMNNILNRLGYTLKKH